MNWLDILPPIYLAGMVVQATHTAERARENRDNDPTLALLPRSRELQILMAVWTIASSPAWPIFAVLAGLRWLGGRAHALADRLRQYAENRPDDRPGRKKRPAQSLSGTGGASTIEKTEGTE